MIFYFSATGNSRYVAERIAAATGDETISIPDCCKSDRFSFDETDKTVGIVCPTYSWGLPSIVQEFLEKLTYPMPEALYVSPLCRCVETAGILFPGKSFHIIEELSECDFGEFENKNYKELSGNQDYQRWIDSNGTLPFPGGESREEFKRRSLTGFQKAVTQCIRNNTKTAALVIHGGTIMNIMEEYADRPRAFYEWHVKNGGGYLAELEPWLWQKGRRELCVREAYMEG